mmetsp:Transcript_23968/g.95111  ORF Transcript_23968/g.95111 Transcript_23968/m.95111 type:complete len:113 (-) Transcript_23968:300-638(-)
MTCMCHAGTYEAVYYHTAVPSCLLHMCLLVVATRTPTPRCALKSQRTSVPADVFCGCRALQVPSLPFRIRLSRCADVLQHWCVSQTALLSLRRGFVASGARQQCIKHDQSQR